MIKWIQIAVLNIYPNYACHVIMRIYIYIDIQNKIYKGKSIPMTALWSPTKDAILPFISGKDVFVALPTGYGKSLIYAFLPKVYDYCNVTEACNGNSLYD